MSHRMQCKHRSQYFTIPTRRREHSDYMELTLGGNDDWLSENVSVTKYLLIGNWNRAKLQNILSKSSINQLGSKRAVWDVTDTGMPWSNDDPWQVVTVEWPDKIPTITLLTWVAPLYGICWQALCDECDDDALFTDSGLWAGPASASRQSCSFW